MLIISAIGTRCAGRNSGSLADIPPVRVMNTAGPVGRLKQTSSDCSKPKLICGGVESFFKFSFFFPSTFVVKRVESNTVPLHRY